MCFKVLNVSVDDIYCTQFVEAAVSELLSAQAQLLQVHALEAQRTLVSFSIRGTVGVWDGQAVPRHVTEEREDVKD